MKWKLIITVLLPVLAIAGPMSMDQCKQLALTNNPELEIARIDHLQAEENVRQFHGKRLPALDFSGSYKYQSVVPELVVPPVDLGFGQPITVFDGPMTLGSNDSYDFAITLSQPLFTGKQLKNTDQSLRYLADSKAITVESKKQELMFQVEVGYYLVQKTAMIIETAATAREQVEAHLTDVRRFFEQGMARKDDVMKVEVKLSEAELSIIQAEHAYATAVANLENIVGQELSDVALDSIVIDRFVMVDMEQALQLALSNRPEFQNLGAMRMAAASSVKAAQGAYLPTVAAFGVLGYGKPGLDFVANEWMDYWVAGVSAEWSLWDWGSTSAKVQTANLNVNKIDESMTRLEQAVKLDVTRSVLQVKEALKRMELSDKMVAQTSETFRIVENNFQNGMADNSDFLDVQLDMTRANLNLVRAKIDYLIALSNLKRAEGILIVE